MKKFLIEVPDHCKSSSTSTDIHHYISKGNYDSALAGCTVCELPEPADVEDELDRLWELYYKDKSKDVAPVVFKRVMRQFVQSQSRPKIEPTNVEEELDRLWIEYSIKNDNLWSITDFKSVLRQFVQSQVRPKVKLTMVETGIIDLPNGYWLQGDHDRIKSGDKIDLCKFSYLKSFCKPESIQTTVDYSKIVAGSELRCTSKSDKCIGFFKCYDNINNTITLSLSFPYSCGNTRCIDCSCFSIEILALPSEATK